VVVAEIVVLMVAVLAGLAARSTGLPPMVGFLVAGFAMKPLAGYWPALAAVDYAPLVDVGITLLLFTIGLKLDLRFLARPFVWAVTCIHMGAVMALVFALLVLLKLLGWGLVADLTALQQLTVGFALSFSSTVFAVKVLEARGEMASLQGKTAIGILVMQDILAVAYLSATGDGTLSLFAPLVLLMLPLRRPLHGFLQRCGHGELLVLAGIAIAFCSYELFELVGLKGGLGALFAGAVLARTIKGNELAKSLLTIKDLLLVGFFLSLGQYGLPGREALLMALLFTALLVFRPVLYFLLLTRFHLRAQTAWFAALGLNHYSEFGLIVMALAAEAGLVSPQWLVIVAISMALSFVFSSAVNLYGDALYGRFHEQMARLQSDKRLPEQAPIDVGGATILVMGMGRLGTGAYDYLQSSYGHSVLGFEENVAKVEEHTRLGRKVLVGDASDLELWQRLPHERIGKIILALSNHSETMRVTEILQGIGYNGVIAAVAKFDDDLRELRAKGVIAFNFYAEAGAGFAEHVVAHLARGGEEPAT